MTSMATSSRPDLQRELNQAFDAFRAALQQMLEAEAQRAVEAAIGRLSSEGEPFKVVGADVGIVIRELKLTTGSEAQAAPARRRRSTPRSTGRRPGRARGAVREGLIAAFAASDREMSADDVREALAQRGVKTSTDNLYQQLRRLVQAGELTRVGRGRYVRAPTAAAA
jgi:hypothetical protein